MSEFLMKMIYPQSKSSQVKSTLVKAMAFPVLIYGCESWTIKKAEHWRIDAFELWCWRRLLRVPWTARRSNQFILKETSPEYSLEGLMLKLKLQYFGHLMQRTESLEKTLMLGKIECRRRRGWQRMNWIASLTQWTWVWINSGSWWWIERPGVLQSMGSQIVRQDWAIEVELNWTDVFICPIMVHFGGKLIGHWNLLTFSTHVPWGIFPCFWTLSFHFFLQFIFQTCAWF